jgi:hypothetical protein
MMVCAARIMGSTMHFRKVGYKLQFKPLKTEFLLNTIYKFSSYLTGNTLGLRYKDQPAIAVWGLTLFTVFCENHTKHTDALRGQSFVS